MPDTMPDIAEVWSKKMSEDEVKASILNQNKLEAIEGSKLYYPEVKCKACGTMMKPELPPIDDYVYYICEGCNECNNCLDAVCDGCEHGDQPTYDLGVLRCFGTYKGSMDMNIMPACSKDDLYKCKTMELCRQYRYE
ncbi:MAG: hypothetical protein ACYC27_02945 [Armatimonadota bacterium]